MNTITRTIQPHYLITCFRLLSLDMLLPYYECFGLYLTDKKKFQASVKENFVQQDVRGWTFDDFPYEKIIVIVKKVEAGLSQKDFYNLFWFMYSVYDCKTDEYYQWYFWNEVMRQSSNEKLLYLRPFIQSEYEKFVPRIKGFYNSRSENSKKLAELSNFSLQNLSSWDKSFFEADNPERESESEWYDPFSNLYCACTQNDFQMFWTNNILTLSDSDLDIIYKVCFDIQSSKSHSGGRASIKSETGELIEYEYGPYTFPNLVPPRQLTRKIIM